MRFLKTALLAAFLLPLTLAAQVYNTVVFNRNGQPIAGASVAVCLAAPPQPLSSTNACGNGNFATLYTNQGLGTPGPNPVTTDAYGNAVIFAQPGIYYTVVYGYLITPHQNIIAVPVGSGGTPHNLLSATHPDTVAYSPPVFGDIIVGNGSGKWARVAGNSTVSQYCFVEQGDGANVTSAGFVACPGGSPDATYQKNSVTVGQQPRLNFLTSASVIPTVTNNSGNTSVDVSFSATTEVAPPPPFAIPTGEAVAWAYPSNCTPTGTASLGSVQCGTTSGIVDRKVSCPLCDTDMGQTWDGFTMPTLPNDAVIQGIYGVMISNRTSTPVAIMALTCNATSFPVGGATTKWSGEFATTTLGTLSSVVTGGSCSVNSAANINLGTFGDDIVNTQLVAMAIYYTTADPPNQVAVPLFVQPYYPSVIGVSPTFASVSDASPIAWDLQHNFIQNGIVSLNHSTSTRALNVSNMQAGGFYHLAFVQDSTGGASVTLGSGCTWIVNNSPTSTLSIPLTANAVSVAEVTYDGTYCYADLTQNNSGTTLSNAGAWQPAPTGYVSGQIVQYNSCSYMAVGSSISVPPNTDNTLWTLLACDGTNGANGTNGTNGTNGAPGAPGYSPNQVLSGGGVAWTGSGLNFVVSPTSYLIAGTQYSCPLTGLTDAAADPSLDRIDAIICDKTGTASFLSGTASATPTPPAIDITSQIQLTFVYVAAGATIPSDVTITDLYHENAEWPCTVSGGTVVCNSSSTPHSGTLNIKYTAAASAAWSQLTIPSGTVDLGQWTNFNLWVKNDAVVPTTRSLVLQWFNGTTAKCSPVTIQSGNFGYDVTKTTWQQITIPTSVFACSGIPVTRIRATVGGTGTNLTIHLDDITLQGGLAPPTVASGLSCPDWNATSTFNVNSCVYYPTTGSSYLALQTNTNKVPTNASNWKPLDIHGPAGSDGNIQIKAGAANSAINTVVSGSDVTFPGILYATEFRSTDLVNNTEIQFQTGSGGDSTCPTPTAGKDFLCIIASALNLSNDGGAYAPLSLSTGSVTNIATTTPIAGGTITTTGTISCPTCAIGPGTSTANHLAKFSGTDGVTLADGGAIPAGTVTSVATTSPITGGTITGTGTIACATCTTNAAAATANQLIIGGGSQAVAALGSLGTTTTVLHGNAGGAPSFGAIVPADTNSTLNVYGIGGVFGSDNGSALVTADINPQASVGQFIVAGTLTTIIVKGDAGVSTIKFGYRHTAATTSYTSAVLTLAVVAGITDTVACANVAGTAITIDGVSVTCSTLATQTMTLGDSIITNGGAADGTTKRIAWTFVYTR
jgi:hypothetical protein